MEIRLLEGYLNEILARQSMASRGILESRMAVEALKTLPANGGSEMLVSIGGGVFVNGKSEPIDKLVVSIGSDYAVEKSQEAAMTFLEERINGMGQVIESLEKQKSEISARMNQDRSALNEILSNRAKQ